MVKFSIIIPVKAINDYVRETVPYIQSLDGDNWELLILPNEAEPDQWCDDRIKIIPSGRIGPADKRDLGARYAVGEILVFLDDDSYPNKDLLIIANQHFCNRQIVAVGGPAITPPNDSFWQRVSGAVFLSKFSGGNPERYMPLGSLKEVDDWPSVNFIVRRKDFLLIGGFNSKYWPGEDTKLCLELIKATNKKIMYDPALRVWHHRRAGLKAHLKQVGAYGLHRGYFARRYPETSRKLIYFIPSIFFIFILLSTFTFILPTSFNYLILFGWIVYIASLVKSVYDIKKYETLSVSIATIPYIFTTHIYYGLNFIKGILTTNLKSKLR